MAMRIFVVMLILVLMAIPMTAASSGGEAQVAKEATKTPTKDATADYALIDLKEMVPHSRMALAGQHAYFVPAPVKFHATLAAMPRAVKTDLLKKSLSMMQIVEPPKVNQAIGIDYGGEKALLAYIEEATAARLKQELKIGDERTFYAYHVYNFNKGPAFVVVSYE